MNPILLWHYLVNAKINIHTNIPNIIKYFFKLIFSFKINLEAKIVITIELDVITETVDT